MNCQEVMELMQRQLDDDLDESEREVLMNHTRQCPDCAAMFERLQLLSAELTSLPKVMPSYSLVDAIMPQLEQIELFGQSEEGPSSIISMTDGSKRRSKRVRRWPSIRVMSGVLAAGIVAGLFLVTYNSGSIGDMSASLFTANKSNNSAADMSNESLMEMSYTADMAAADDAGGSEVRTEAAGQRKADAPEEVVSESGAGIPKSANGENSVRKQTTDEDGSIKGGTSNPSEGNVDNKDEKELGMTSNSTALLSPDGQYSGKVENSKITISAAADQSIIFTSPRKNGELVNLIWSEDSTTLTYEVHVEKGAIEKYVIDLATLKEQKAPR